MSATRTLPEVSLSQARPSRLRQVPYLRLVSDESSSTVSALGVVREIDGAMVSGRRAGAGRYSPSSTRPARRARAQSTVRYAPVRLTRRGRFVVRGLLLLAAVLTLIGIAASGQASTEAAVPDAGMTVVVERGDTLWNLADRYLPDRNTAVAVEQIAQLNSLTASRIEVGQQLRLPR